MQRRTPQVPRQLGFASTPSQPEQVPSAGRIARRAQPGPFGGPWTIAHAWTVPGPYGAQPCSPLGLWLFLPEAVGVCKVSVTGSYGSCKKKPTPGETTRCGLGRSSRCARSKTATASGSPFRDLLPILAGSGRPSNQCWHNIARHIRKAHRCAVTFHGRIRLHPAIPPCYRLFQRVTADTREAGAHGHQL